MREKLPLLLTGEKTEAGVREHLARCAACRTRRDRLAAEMGLLREGLAELAPSPFLEDAVLAEARDPQAAKRPRRPWAYVALAAAAAAALFLAVIWPRLDLGSQDTNRPTEKGPLGRSAVDVPPSAGEVERAREANRNTGLRLSSDALFGRQRWHQGVVEGDGPTAVRSDRFLAPWKKAQHRFVFGDPEGEAGDRTYRVALWPSEKVILLGSGLLSAIGCRVLNGEQLTLEVEGRRWHSTPGSFEGEISLASPDENGAEGRVRVSVSTGYSGTLLIEGPLARALGLHQFEIPGEVRFQTPGGGDIPVRAHRARARVRIEELGFDGIVEVQVVRARPWMVKYPSVPTRGLTLEGEAPVSVVYGTRFTGGRNFALHESVHLENREPPSPGVREVDPGDGTWRFLLGFSTPSRDWRGYLVPQAFDFHSSSRRVFRVVRTRVNGRWEPGGEATFARVWRGTTAIPSAEAVAKGCIDEEGRLTFPRLAGEPGATLRMLYTKKDGTSSFHEVVVASDLLSLPRMTVQIHASGFVTTQGFGEFLYRKPGQVGEAASPRPEVVAKRLVALKELLRRRAQPPTLRDEGGYARLELRLEVESHAPWRLVMWILVLPGDPGIRIDRIRLVAAGERARTHFLRLQRDLEADGTPRSREASRRAGPVTIERGEPGGPLTTRYPFERTDGRRPSAETVDYAEGISDDRLSYAPGSPRRIDVPTPDLVTFGEVFAVLEKLRAQGVEEFRFWERPIPIDR